MKVLIASGGSGGHIFPARSLAQELIKRGVDIIFVASRRRLDKKILQNTPYRKIYLSANPMPYGFGYETFIFLAKLFLDSLQAIYILIAHKPDVIVGFGGYTAGAVVLLGRAMNIKTVIHEQNIIPGRTNRFLEGFVNTVAVSFDESKKYFKNKNVCFTGNPLREESLIDYRENAHEKFGLARDKFTILIMGGSQGAMSLNNLISKSLCLLPQKEKENLQVVHITGMADGRAFSDFYSKNGIEGKIFEFVNNINEAYSVSDLAISRSGAAAIFELAAFGKPAILIPYPDRKNSQRLNAMFFADKNAAIVRDEEGLREDEIRDLISELINNPEKRETLSRNIKKLSVVDGAKRLAEVVIGTLNSKQTQN